VEAARDVRMDGWTLQPLAGLSYVRTKTDGFTESGAGALDLQVDEQTTTSTRSLLGARTLHDFGGLKLQPRLVWVHEFGSVNTAPLTATLTGAPAAGSFQVTGVEVRRNSAQLGLGASGAISKRLALFADAQIEGTPRQRSSAIFVGLRGSW